MVNGERVDRWTDKWMVNGGWMDNEWREDGWMDEWRMENGWMMDGWMDGRMDG